MENLLIALKGSILELTENMVRLQWHLEATKDETDAAEKRPLMELVLKLRDILAFIPFKKSKSKRKSESPIVAVEKFVNESKASMEEFIDRLDKLMTLIQGELDEDTTLAYAKNVKEAAKVFTEDFESYLKTRPSRVTLRCELFVRVAEAKQLPAKDFTGTSDPFCWIIIDDEKYAKTQTIWKTLNPCWLRDFDLDIPVDAKSITFSIWDKDKTQSDEFIGERALSLAALPNGLLHESWMSLLPKGYGKSIFTKANIKVRYRPVTDDSPNLFVTILDIMDVDAYEVQTVIMDTTATEPSATDQQWRTQVLREKEVKDNPHRAWNETFTFKIKVDQAPNHKIGIFFYRGKHLVAETFLAVSSVVSQDGKSEVEHSHAIPITPKPFKKLGEFRVQLKRINYKILSSHAYDELLMLMLHDDETVRYISDLCENVGRRKDIIKSVVSVLADRGVVETFINTVTTAEINATADTGTLFRANSFSAICVDAYLNLVGVELLQKVLKDIVLDIYRCKSKKSCEVDTSRFTKNIIGGGDTLEKNLENLRSRVTAIWVNIQGTVDDMPRPLRNIFANLQETAAKHWPEDQTVRYLAPSGFLFLRFFCAAVLGPHLFQLTDEYPENKIARNLTLISKTLMNLGNLVVFGAKEPFLVPINDFISAEIPRMKLYIDTVAKKDSRSPEPKIKIDYEKEMSHIQSFLSDMAPKIEEAIKTKPNIKLSRLLAVNSRLEASLEVNPASAAAVSAPLMKKRASSKKLVRTNSQKKKSRRSLSASIGTSHSLSHITQPSKRNSDAPVREAD